MSATKIRLRFAKQGDLRLVSHHDLLRCFERMIRRAALPVAHSQGFNPRPRLVFPLALALGIEGLREVVELELSEPLTPEEARDRLANAAPDGLTFLEAEAVGPGRSPRVATACYALPIPEARIEAARDAVRDFLSRDHVPYSRHRPDRPRSREIDLRAFVVSAAIGPDGRLRFRLAMASDGSARPEEVVEALGLRDLLSGGAVLAREDVELAPPRAAAGPSPADIPNPNPNPTDCPSPTAIRT